MEHHILTITVTNTFALGMKVSLTEGILNMKVNHGSMFAVFEQLIGFGLSLFKHATNYARAEIVAIGTVPLGRLILEITQMKTQKGRS